MTRDLTHRDPDLILPGDPPGMIRVPAWRLDEVERLRAEVAELRQRTAPAGRIDVGRSSAPAAVARRETRVGPLHAIREDTARPSKTHATPERATALADLILSLRAMGALGLAGLAFLGFVLVAALGTGLVFLALRFVSWARHGDPTGGAIVLGLAGFVIVATGVAGFLRITDPRRTR